MEDVVLDAIEQQDSQVPTLTGSLFAAGLQCPKLLCRMVHEPMAVELQPDIVLQDRFDQGAYVGVLAQELFGEWALIDRLGSRAARYQATKAAIGPCVPILGLSYP